MRFRPPLAASIFVFFGLPLLIGLGVWQLQRLEWKLDLIERVETGLAAEPVALPADIADPARWDYRPVSLSGRYDHENSLHVQSRTLDGAVGIHLVTPLIRENGRPVLVNRGWLPLDRVDPASRPGSNPPGPVALSGVARVPEGPGPFTPPPDRENNRWYAIEIPAMAAAIGLTDPAPVIVEAGPGADGVLPIGGQTRVTFRNDHLSYAITWFFFAAALVVFYILSGVKRQGR